MWTTRLIGRAAEPGGEPGAPFGWACRQPGGPPPAFTACETAKDKARRPVSAGRDEEFTHYVQARLTWLRRIAYMPCQDWQRADDLSETGLSEDELGGLLDLRREHPRWSS